VKTEDMAELRMVVIACGKYIHICDVWDSQGSKHEYRLLVCDAVYFGMNISEERAASTFRLEAPLLEATGYSETLIP
jgi:hypothetical protein